MEKRMISTELVEEDVKIENNLRPLSLEDYIGQEKVKRNLKVYIEAAKERGDSLDHVLFYGPPGLGKTTLAGIIAVSLYQRINLLNRTILLFLGGTSLVIAGIIYSFSMLSRQQIDIYSTTTANVFLFVIIIGFIVAGMRKKINVYDAFVEGAKEGFTTAVRIIPYLVAILVAIGVFRASGCMDYLIEGIANLVNLCGINSDFVGALPTALMKPLSGSGARGLMVDAMNTYGADSFVGRLSCIFQGSTDTTFYILAVYFGSVGVVRTRHAVPCGLLADLAGIIAAILICYLFFN